MYKIRIKKGDTVVVTAGKYKGQSGKVLATHPKENKITIEGINVEEKTLPMWVSKVAVIDPADKKPTKIGYKFNKDGNKVRVYKRSGKEMK
jgi:large subunit ribosomal protein L24